MHSLRFEEDAKKMLACISLPAKIVDACIGHGAYSDLFRENSCEVIPFVSPAQIEETLIPHRTISAIWLSDSCQDIAPSRLASILSFSADWLIPGGCIALVLRAGEGIKRVNDHVVHQYQPEQVEQLLQGIGLKTAHAWIDGPLERQSMHIIAQVV